MNNDTNEGLSKKERKQMIIKEINVHSRVTYDFLAQHLKVSEDTIRRDINELSKNMDVVQIKGGVMSNAYHNHKEGNLYNLTQKRIIAQKLVGLLKKDMVLLLGGGTTISEFIKMIPPQFKMTVFTVNLLSAVELLEKPNIKTIFLGGEISKFSQMSIGATVVMNLRDIKPDLCIIGANAIDLEEGFPDSDWDTVEVKKAMVSVSYSLAVLSITDKLNSIMKYKIADVDKINYFVTEASPDAEIFSDIKVRFPKIILL